MPGGAPDGSPGPPARGAVVGGSVPISDVVTPRELGSGPGSRAADVSPPRPALSRQAGQWPRGASIGSSAPHSGHFRSGVMAGPLFNDSPTGLEADRGEGYIRSPRSRLARAANSSL